MIKPYIISNLSWHHAQWLVDIAHNLGYGAVINAENKVLINASAVDMKVIWELFTEDYNRMWDKE